MHSILNFSSQIINIVWAIPLLIIYNYGIFILVGTILEKPRLKRIPLILVSCVNTISCIALINHKQATTEVWYIILFVALLVEFYIFHKDKMKRVLFVTLACVIHVMSIRSISVASLAIITKQTLFDIANNVDSIMVTTNITVLILDIAIILVMKYIPKDKLKIINQHTEQLLFMCTWLSVFTIYLLIDAKVYTITDSYPYLNVLQIITPCVIMIGTYVVLFFSINTTVLLGYREKNSELELKIQKEQQYRKSMLTDSILTYEFNLSNNKMISGFDEYKEEFGDISGFSYNKFLMVLAQRVVHPDDLISFVEYTNITRFLEELDKGRSESSTEYRRKKLNGEYIWVRSITNLVEDMDTGDIKGFTYVKDIDHEKKLQLELKRKAERDPLTGLYNKAMMTKLVSEYLHNDRAKAVGVLMMIDVDNFKDINDHFGHAYGDEVLQNLAEKLEKIFKVYDIVGRIGGDEFMVFMKGSYHKKTIEEKADEIRKCFATTYKEGEKVYSISGSIGIALSPLHGEVFEELYKKADIALYTSKNKGKNTTTIYEGENFNGYISDRVECDDVTGGITYAQFKQQASVLLSENSKIKYIFVRVDINDFRVINGMYGFEEGDKILQVMAKAIKNTINETELFARMSNDNFIVLTSYTDEIGIYHQGERFKDNFNIMHRLSGLEYRITFTIGFSKVEAGETDTLQLIEKATMAHKAAKKMGLGMLCYDESLKQDAVKTKTMENTMHAALENGDFVVYLQPKYGLNTSVMEGAEALIRWQDAAGTLIPPNEFIPLFEKNGFIAQIDIYVLEQVCKMQRAWIDQGIKPVVISVNQSKVLISMSDYVERICSVVKKYDIDPGLIELELTETTIHNKIHELRKILKTLQDMGFIISIDDFGSGYSSLSMLKEVNANVLKIDREFLNRSEDNDRGRIVLRNVIRLAKELQMSVVTEGVETQRQSDMLRSLNCDMAQGFLYAKPMPVKDFEKFLLTTD